MPPTVNALANLEITTETNADSLSTGLAILELLFDQASMTRYAKQEAEKLIDLSRKAPVPYKTGVLSNSAKVEITGDGEATFGFTVEYAAIQDQGSRDGTTLPPKKFGSKKGPNYYFSGTIKKELTKVLGRVTKAMRAEMKSAGGAAKAVNPGVSI